jgi:UDP-N-acetylmuramate--alanine ligase
VQRRFELKGQFKGHQVVEDYAHHPTEIRATLSAALGYFDGQKPMVVFQPHRFTRTRDQWAAFKSCFEGASSVITLPIYAASEPRDEWTKEFDGENFAKNIQVVPSCFAPSIDEAVALCKDQLLKAPKGSPLLVLGAGDVYKVALKLLSEQGDGREINP